MSAVSRSATRWEKPSTLTGSAALAVEMFTNDSTDRAHPRTRGTSPPAAATGQARPALARRQHTLLCRAVRRHRRSARLARLDRPVPRPRGHLLALTLASPPGT